MEGIESADVITAGFPCQDISYAGAGAGLSGERSGVGWWKTRRAIRLVRPRVALLENVAALLNRGLGTVLGSLASIGYDTEWHCIPACAVGAPHIRDRIWIVAHSQSERWGEEGEPCSDTTERTGGAGTASAPLADTAGAGLPDGKRSELSQDAAQDGAGMVAEPERCGSNVPDTESLRVQGQRPCRVEEPLAHALEGLLVRCREGAGKAQWEVEPSICRVVDGLPNRVDRVKALGNAVVPQIPEAIGYAIAEKLLGKDIV